jgi:hypothetical protein
VKSLIKGMQWYDKKWKLISRYFVPTRTAEFLEGYFIESLIVKKER